ncbi:hypothetical protein F2Q68_00044879 [Brassica cretica]|uniref:Uncharacterized protein n=1 Tax=Brassica cretica TaxID=69181 RepID=A0A8S9LIZ4_BRACR|nr:hypothetical protein F2Q68_00044879 [Brassica cretica]
MCATATSRRRSNEVALGHLAGTVAESSLLNLPSFSGHPLLGAEASADLEKGQAAEAVVSSCFASSGRVDLEKGQAEGVVSACLGALSGRAALEKGQTEVVIVASGSERS